MNTYGRKFVTAPEWYKGKRYRGRYALQYRVIAEKMIGRALKENEIVHHKDGDKRNNSESNLQVMTKSKHTQHHGYEKGTEMAEIQCPVCEKPFVRRAAETIANPERTKTSTCSKKCLAVHIFKKDKSGFVQNKIIRLFRKYSGIA